MFIFGGMSVRVSHRLKKKGMQRKVATPTENAPSKTRLSKREERRKFEARIALAMLISMSEMFEKFEPSISST